MEGFFIILPSDHLSLLPGQAPFASRLERRMPHAG
jgi:hypothetical protein